jgi:hypothetical protein
MKKTLRIMVLVFFTVIAGLNSATAAPAAPEEPLLMGKLVRDYRTLQQLCQASDQAIAEMTTLGERLSKAPLLKISDEEQLSAWFFSVLQIRKALARIAFSWRPILARPDLTALKREKILEISFAAFIEWYKLACYLSQQPSQIKMIRKKLNEAVPEFGIPAQEFTRVLATLANSDLREKVDAGFLDIRRVFAQKKTTEQAFQKRLKTSYEYLQTRAPDPWKMRFKVWLKKIGTKSFNQFYFVETAVGTWLGDTKYRRRRPSIHYDLVNQMKTHLKPGDILLERENWFLSNIFLPGFWKHGILYVGTNADLAALGLTKHPAVARHLPEFNRPDHLGFEKRLIEAISDGVVMNSMEEATDADYVCALRPRLTEDQIKQVIVTAFSHVGKAYDFNFDFQTADKIVCTELLYRAFKDFLPINLQRVMGRWAFSADDLLKTFLASKAQSDADLDFVFFLDSDPDTQKAGFRDEKALRESIKRPSIDIFLKNEEIPVPPHSAY